MKGKRFQEKIGVNGLTNLEKKLFNRLICVHTVGIQNELSEGKFIFMGYTNLT